MESLNAGYHKSVNTNLHNIDYIEGIYSENMHKNDPLGRTPFNLACNLNKKLSGFSAPFLHIENSGYIDNIEINGRLKNTIKKYTYIIKKISHLYAHGRKNCLN